MAGTTPKLHRTWLSLHDAAVLLAPALGYEGGCRVLTAALIAGDLTATLEPGVAAMALRPDEWEQLFQQGYYIDWDTGNVAVPVGIDEDDILYAPRLNRGDVERIGRCSQGDA